MKKYRNKYQELKEKLEPFKRHGFFEPISTIEEEEEVIGPIQIDLQNEVNWKKCKYDKEKYTIKMSSFPNRQIYKDDDTEIFIKEENRNQIIISLRDYYKEQLNELVPTEHTFELLFKSSDLLEQLLVVELIKRSQFGEIKALNTLYDLLKNRIEKKAEYFYRKHLKEMKERRIDESEIKSQASLLAWSLLAGDKLGEIYNKIMKAIENQTENLMEGIPIATNFKKIMLKYIDKDFPLSVWELSRIVLTRNGQKILNRDDVVPTHNPDDKTKAFKTNENFFQSLQSVAYNEFQNSQSMEYDKFLGMLKPTNSQRKIKDTLLFKETGSPSYSSKRQKPILDAIKKYHRGYEITLIEVLQREANPLLSKLINPTDNKNLFHFRKKEIPGKTFNVWLFGVPCRHGELEKKLTDWYRQVKTHSHIEESFDDSKQGQESKLPYINHNKTEKSILNELLKKYKKKNNISIRDINISKELISIKLNKEKAAIQKIAKDYSLSERQIRRIYSPFKEWIKLNKKKKLSRKI